MFRRLGITSVVAANALSQILARTDVASSGFLAAQHVTIKHSSAIGNHIGLVGFEPTASWSRTRRSTKLSHSPNWIVRRARLLTSRILRRLARGTRPRGGARELLSNKLIALALQGQRFGEGAENGQARRARCPAACAVISLQ